jgi:RNA polymerase sigma-70 factor (ECF subfamily)
MKRFVTQSNVVYLAGRRDDSRDAFLENLFTGHVAALRRFLRLRFIQQADQEDLIQDVFLRLAGLEDLEERLSQRTETVRSYLFSIAGNLIRDRHRRAAVRLSSRHVSFDDKLTKPGSSVSPEDLLMASQDVVILKRSLMKLKPRRRRAFVLSRFHNQSYSEIAEELGVSVSTVEKYISSALHALRKELT